MTQIKTDKIVSNLIIGTPDLVYERITFDEESVKRVVNEHLRSTPVSKNYGIEFFEGVLRDLRNRDEAIPVASLSHFVEEEISVYRLDMPGLTLDFFAAVERFRKRYHAPFALVENLRASNIDSGWWKTPSLCGKAQLLIYSPGCNPIYAPDLEDLF